MRHLFRTLVLAATLTLPVAAFSAEEAKPVTASVAGLPGGKYNLDASHANIGFTINHLGFSHYKGRFNSFDGTLFLDPANPEKSNVKFTVDVTSIDTNNAELQGKLKSDKFFDTAKFARASFTSTKLTKVSDTQGKLTGDLSIRGVTRPVTFDVTLVGAGANPFSKKQTVGFSAVGTIKRSDFGIKEYVPAVGDEVTLTVDAEFAQDTGE